MTITVLVVLFLKVTLTSALALAALALLKRAGAALRHLLCAAALLGALVLPASLLVPPRALALRVPFAFSTAAAPGASPTSSPFAPAAALSVIWLIGATLLLTRIVIGHWRVGRVLRSATPMGEDTGVPVFEADVAVPLACGLIRSAILMPRGSAALWLAAQSAAALRHERAHIERSDLWTNLMGHFACAVWWFHPLVWAVARRMRQEQETACDDAVLQAGFEPASYAEALLAAAQSVQLSDRTSLMGCHMLTRQTLKTRIARLLDASTPRITSTTTLRRAAVACTAVVACIGLLNARPQSKTDDAKAAGRVYKVADGVTPPRLVFRVEPKYTEEARAAKIEGAVHLSVIVGPDGLAHDINVISTPDAGLGGKAVEAIEKWHFEPGKLNGEPVPVQAQIEVNFKLM